MGSQFRVCLSGTKGALRDLLINDSTSKSRAKFSFISDCSEARRLWGLKVSKARRKVAKSGDQNEEDEEAAALVEDEDAEGDSQSRLEPRSLMHVSSHFALI